MTENTDQMHAKIVRCFSKSGGNSMLKNDFVLKKSELMPLTYAVESEKIGGRQTGGNSYSMSAKFL